LPGFTAFVIRKHNGMTDLKKETTLPAGTDGQFRNTKYKLQEI